MNLIICLYIYTHYFFQALEKIEERLPKDFYQKRSQWTSNNFDYNPCQIKLLHDPLFYIPLKDDFPILNNLVAKKQKDISLLYVQPVEKTVPKYENNKSYPLQTMFECYKDSIPSYNYNEFKTIILNELQSVKSDEEIMDYFLETFGYGAIDFLAEVIRHRNKIEYSPPTYGR